MIENPMKMARRFGVTTSIVILSQGISAFTLFLLPLLGLGVSDVYAFAIQIALGPYNGLIMGVMYLLVIGRPHFSSWVQMRVIAALFSLLLTLGALYYVYASGHHYKLPREIVMIITSACGCGGIGLAISSIRGVREACAGRPSLLAGITIVPNVAMGATTLLVVLLARHSVLGAAAPAIAGMLANFAMAIWAMVAPTPCESADLRPTAESEHSANLFMQALGLVLGVVSSTIFPIGFVAAVSKLSTGSATVLFLVSRIGSAIIGILINSVLLVQHNWKSQSQRLGSFSFRMAVVAIVAATAGAFAHFGHAPLAVGYALVLVAWLSSLSATPVVSREVNRRRLGSVIALKSTLDVLISAIALAWLYQHPSITGYFGIYMLSQGVTCLVFAFRMREYRLAAASAVLVPMAAMLLALGW